MIPAWKRQRHWCAPPAKYGISGAKQRTSAGKPEGGDIQGEEAVEGKFFRVRGNSGGVILEGAPVEASWNKCTAY